MSEVPGDGAPSPIQQEALEELQLGDWLLRSFVDAVNGTEAAISVILYVGGLVVAGYLVSGHSYFEAIGEALKSSVSDQNPEHATQVREAFQRRGAELYAPGSLEGEVPPPPQYVHLREARVYHPGPAPLPANQGFWWRGRLDAVDGFSLGTLSFGEG